MQKSVELILHQYRFNLAYAKQLTGDINESDFDKVFGAGLVNHAAFTLGHLVTGSALIVEDLGGEYKVPKGWNDMFLRKGPGDPRLPLDVKYPSQTELISELEKQHSLVETMLQGASEEDLEAELNWRFSSYMPSLLDAIAFLAINHEAMHLGQLAAWRREAGYSSALSKL